MGVGMEPGYYYAPRPYYYQQPRRVIVINRPLAGMQPLPPQFVPIPANQRIAINSTNVVNPMMFVNPQGQVLLKKQKKKTIDNLAELLEERNLTKEMLEKEKKKNCSICLDDFVVGDKIMYLPCFHYYHSKCIEKWAHSSDKCPLCNTEIDIQ